MSIRQHITDEVAALRTKAAQIVQDAEAEKAKLEAEAVALEQKVANIPAEIEQLADEAAARAWAWIKSLRWEATDHVL